MLLLPHKAFAPQTRQNHGLQNVAPLRSHIAFASATIAMPLLALKPYLFCLISPEACLLTLKKLSPKKTPPLNLGEAGRGKNAGRGLTEKRAGRMA